jgi:hypothetical protein
MVRVCCKQLFFVDFCVVMGVIVDELCQDVMVSEFVIIISLL